jgi:hypothetical protein
LWIWENGGPGSGWSRSESFKSVDEILNPNLTWRRGGRQVTAAEFFKSVGFVPPPPPDEPKPYVADISTVEKDAEGYSYWTAGGICLYRLRGDEHPQMFMSTGWCDSSDFVDAVSSIKQFKPLTLAQASKKEPTAEIKDAVPRNLPPAKEEKTSATGTFVINKHVTAHVGMGAVCLETAGGSYIHIPRADFQKFVSYYITTL